MSCIDLASMSRLRIERPIKTDVGYVLHPIMKISGEQVGKRTWQIWESFNYTMGGVAIVSPRDLLFYIGIGPPLKLVGDKMPETARIRLSYKSYFRNTKGIKPS